ncbi:MAG TPA: DUF3349 domain-containing protein [Propionibacteriaceae bacterium]
MSLGTWVSSVIGWLRAGYPEGIPEADYIPLVAVLARRLSTDQIREITGELVRMGSLPIDNIDIGTVITKVTNELPREEDVTRVRSKLALGGWPLADPRAV